jgi:hypothetical protein
MSNLSEKYSKKNEIAEIGISIGNTPEKEKLTKNVAMR